MNVSESPLEHLQQQVEQDSFEQRDKIRKSLQGQQESERKTSPKKSHHQEPVPEPPLKVDEAPMVQQKMSIFVAKAKDENLPNIFANSKSVNLFSLNGTSNQPGSNIFKTASGLRPSVVNDFEDDLHSLSSGESHDHSQSQELPEPVQKVMKFEYQPSTAKVAEFKLTRFKNGQTTARQGVLLSLQRSVLLANDRKLYFVVRSEATKVSLFEAFLLPMSKMEHFMGRPQNWKLWVFKPKTEEDRVQMEREMVKLQFQTEEKAVEFEKCVRDQLDDK